jgi:hypothetical protein
MNGCGGSAGSPHEAADGKRGVPRDDRAATGNERATRDGEHRDAPAESGRTHEPPVGLDDPRVSAVPQATPRPGEDEGQAATRLRRSGQDAWGSPEDQADHDSNAVYIQQDENHA